MRLLIERPRLTNRRPAPGSAPVPPDRHQAWTAEIEWRQTEAGARFCVIARAGDGTGDVNVAESRPLNWPPGRGDSVRALSDAAEKLEASLLAAGWKPLPPGSAWYAKRFMSEPAAEAWPAAQLGPAAPAPPVWVQPVGPAAPAQEQRADPAPESWSPPVTSSLPQRHAGVRERGLEDGDRDTEDGGAAARVDPLPREPDGSGSDFSERFLVRHTLPVALVALFVVAAAVTGLLLARAISDGDGDAGSVLPAATPLTIVHDGLRLQVPSGWAPGEPAMVPGFSRPLFLNNAHERLSGVVERLPATSTTLLPLAFDQALPAARERRESVRLASGQRAWRYRVSQADGLPIVVYAAPTTSGVATVACMRSTEGGVPRGCDALANALTVPGSLPLDPGASAAFFSRLPATVEQLEAARSTGMRELSAAKRAAEQAAAADGLVRAHKAASTALAPLAAADAGLPAKLVGALNATAAAYARLAGAAHARSPQRYDDAGRAVASADAGLRRTLSRAAAAANIASRAATGGAAP